VTRLVHGGDFGTVPGFYSDIKGAQVAGVPWIEFAAYPDIAKNMVFAAMRAEQEAAKRIKEGGGS
jgi:hypothetical protein